MDDSDEDNSIEETPKMNGDEEEEKSSSSSGKDKGSKTRDRLLHNEMRSFRNRGFHDGYDEGKKTTLQEAFNSGYKKAFEQNFILSTLKGVAHALKSSYNLNNINNSNNNNNNINNSLSGNRNTRPTSTTSTLSSSPSTSSTSSSSKMSPSSKTRPRSQLLFGSTTTATSTPTSGDISSSSSTSNVSTTGTSSNINVNVNISNNHLSLLESMNFDNSSDIESIKSDLIRICRENRLEILAHYVSQIG